MARAATDEQVQLRRRARRRLIGAVALVTLIAVVLPWILESEPRPSDHEISIQIPSPDAGGFSSRVAPGKATSPSKPPADAAAPADRPAGGPAGEAGVLQGEQERILAPTAPQSAAQTEKPPGAKAAKAAPPPDARKPVETRDPQADGRQFVVQLGALADAAKADALRKALAAKGVRAYTEVVKTAAGEVTRVRVGPFANRESAEQERTRLKALGYDGNVAPR